MGRQKSLRAVLPMMSAFLFFGSAHAQDEKFRFKLDFGYRWEAGFRGSRDLYRGHLDYGEGPKLFAGELLASSLPRRKWFFDKLQVRMNSWGGEPYNIAHVRAVRERFLDLRFDYQNTRYFNSIPAFANPLLEQGSLISQHRSDFSQRYFRFHARFLPGKKISPFVSYERSSRRGPLHTTLAADGDEFQILADNDDRADDVKFGVTYQGTRFAFLLQQGLRWFKDRSRFSAGPQEGNSSRPIFGEEITLSSYEGQNNVDVFTPFSTAFLSYKPVRQLALRARVSYGISDLETEFRDQVRGNFFSFPPLAIFYSLGRLSARGADIKKPTLWGDFSADWQPLRRFRMVERFTTRRLHISGASALLSTFEDVRPVLGGAIEDPLEIPAFPDSFLAMSLETQELTGFVYPQSRLQIHVGHRYQTRKIKETGQFRAERNVLLLGAAYRLSPGYRVSADYEYGRTDQAIYRLDAVDFQRVRISGEAKPLNKLRVSGNALVFSNDNDLDSIDFTHRTRDFGFNFDYAPVSRFSVSGGFQRTRLTSDLLIIVPQTFLPARSFFRERGNYGELWTNLVLPRRASLRVGYSVWGTTGNFPNTYHRPVARLEIPLGERVVAYARWNYYGYNEKLDLFPQDYRKGCTVLSVI